ITKETVLVASPSAIGNTPEASGSSVPAWPARFAWNRRLTTLTACVELMPTGLSSTTQPCTSRFSRLRACGDDGSASTRVNILILVVEVALHRRCSQQLFDPLGLVETLVELESDVRREFQIDAPRNLAAQETLIAFERGEYRVRIASAERHDVDGREP